MQNSRRALAGCSVVFALALSSGAAIGAQGHAHVHGRAVLQVVVEGAALSLELTTPLDNLIGFEHAPRNEKQTAAVRSMAERLRRHEALFATPSEAGCRLESMALESDVLDPRLLAGEDAARSSAQPPAAATGKKGDAPHAAKSKDGHAALSARYVYRCERAERLSHLEVKLFDTFPGVRRLDAEVVGPRKQAAARLTSKSRRVSW